MKLPKFGVGAQIIAAFVVAGLILVIFIFAIEVPKLVQLGKYHSEVQKEEEKVQKAKDTLKRQKQIKREMADIREKMEEVERKMPKEPEIPQLIKDIQLAAEQSGVELVSLKLEELASFKDYSEIPVEIEVGCRFFDLVDFLYRMHNLPREIKITSIEIGEGERNFPYLAVTMKASVYTFAKGVAGGATSKEGTTSESESSSGQSGGSGSSTSEQPSSQP